MNKLRLIEVDLKSEYSDRKILINTDRIESVYALDRGGSQITMMSGEKHRVDASLAKIAAALEKFNG